MAHWWLYAVEVCVLLKGSPLRRPPASIRRSRPSRAPRSKSQKNPQPGSQLRPPPRVHINVRSPGGLLHSNPPRTTRPPVRSGLVVFLSISPDPPAPRTPRRGFYTTECGYPTHASAGSSPQTPHRSPDPPRTTSPPRRPRKRSPSHLAAPQSPDRRPPRS